LFQMSSSISLLQLPRLCIWTAEVPDGRVLSGVGPHLELYCLLESGEYRLQGRTSVFGACGRPITAVRRIDNSDSFVVIGSSLLCILKESEFADPVVPSSRIHSFTDEIVNIAYAVHHQQQNEFGLVLRSGRTLRVTASIDDANRLHVDTVSNYDRAKCGLLMSALCLLRAGAAADQWKEMRCIAGSAMGEVRLWGTDEGSSSNSTTDCGRIGFVISMAVVDQSDDLAQATVVAVTENRAINLWRIRYRESDWLQLLQKEEAAHAVRPSALAYCSRTRRAVSAAEDGELCVWSVSEGGFSLLRRFQTRVGAVRSLRMDGEGRILYGSVTGSLFSLPLDSLVAQPERQFIEGHKIQPHFRDCDRTPIRSFAVIHHHEKYDGSIAPGTRQTELQCLGEDGSTLEVTGEAVDRVSKRVDNEGSFLHLTSWADRDSAITVFHDEKHIRMSIYHPPDHVAGDDSGYRRLSEQANQSTILTARPTMSRTEKGAEPYVVVQSTSGVIAVVRECHGSVRIWRYRIQMEDESGESTKKRRNQMLIVNSVVIDRSSDTGLHVVLGTTNGRLLYSPLKGEGEQTPEGVSTLDFALDKEKSAQILILYPRSRRLEKTSITQLEYCRERRECTALSKNGWMMRIRVEGDKGLIVSEEDISRELGVEWPVRIERRGEEEYVIGFNARNLVVVSRRLKTCLLSIDCGGGHRQVHVDLEGDREGGGVDRVVVYYGKNQGIVHHSQRSFIAGLRQLTWTPHRDKIVFCTGMDRYVLMGSIDGEIVLGTRDYDSLSVLQRWYVPETTTAFAGKRDDTVLRLVIGGPKGDLYVVDWNKEEKRAPPLTLISTGNDSRIIDVCALGEHVVAAFADAQIAIFKLDSCLRARKVAVWEMPLVHRGTFTKVCVTQADAKKRALLIDAITSAGTLSQLAFDAVNEKIEHVRDISIDHAVLTVIRRDLSSGITVVGSDSGTLFVYAACKHIDAITCESEEALELLEVWRDAHCCQITHLSLFRSSSGKLRVASVGMDCTITVLEMEGAMGKLSLVRRSVFAVNDPSSIAVMSESDENVRTIVAGCGLEIVQL
ncbi:hypothetical protein PENTCL1PPCAC_27587, partial [Pristionchus entomophagus]